MKRSSSAWLAAAALAAMTVSSVRAAQPCDEARLKGFMDGYLQALSHHDPSRLPLARAVPLTENGVPIQLGQGLWITFSSLGTYRHDIYDTETGAVATFASIRENDFPDLEAVFKADQNFGAGTGWTGGLAGESREPAAGEAHK